jgi:hypothetical protein
MKELRFGTEEQRKKKKQEEEEEEENEKRVENKERERKGGETGGGGEGRVIGDSRFSIPTAWGGGEGPTWRSCSSAASCLLGVNVSFFLLWMGC